MIIIIPEKLGKVMSNMYEKVVCNKNQIIYNSVEDVEFEKLKGEKLMFLIELGNSGINIGLFEIMKKIREKGRDCLENSTAAVIIHSDNELYTRTVGRRLIFTLNYAGCSFFGRPIVEATGTLNTFRSYQKLSDLSKEEIFYEKSQELFYELEKFKLPKYKKPTMFVVHSSNKNTSNTRMLWSKVCSNLKGFEIKEIHIENGTIKDCNACPFTACLHFGESNSCFYGGIIIEEVYPEILSCDVLVLLCPNYNDSLSANLLAMVNRLTALFRNNDFSKKYIYSLVVSGYCGSDILAQQLISGININKKFILPPRFCLMQTANDRGEIKKREGIDEIAKKFADDIMSTVLK